MEHDSESHRKIMTLTVHIHLKNYYDGIVTSVLSEQKVVTIDSSAFATLFILLTSFAGGNGNR